MAELQLYAKLCSSISRLDSLNVSCDLSSKGMPFDDL